MGLSVFGLQGLQVVAAFGVDAGGAVLCSGTAALGHLQASPLGLAGMRLGWWVIGRWAGTARATSKQVRLSSFRRGCCEAVDLASVDRYPPGHACDDSNRVRARNQMVLDQER